jgi:hypothetical protein
MEEKLERTSEVDESSPRSSTTASPSNEWSPQRLPKAVSARVAATLFSQRSAESLSALFNDPPIQKDVRIVFPNTRSNHQLTSLSGDESLACIR